MIYGLPYCGSKNRIARKVVDAIPRTPIFIDMMCGGGAISHRVIESRPQTSVHMNDIDAKLMDFLRLLNRGATRE